MYNWGHKNKMHPVQSIYNQRKSRIMKYNIEELLQKPAGELSPEELLAINEHKKEELKKAEWEAKSKYLDARDLFLEATLDKANSFHDWLMEFKRETITQTNHLHQEMYVINGQDAKKQKQVSQKNDKFKVVVESQDRMEFTDEAEVHIEQIKEIMKSKFETRNKGMYAFMESFLIKNSKGDYDPKLLAKAKVKARQLGYEDLEEALNQLQDCQKVVGSAQYCRFYKKVDNKWVDVSIQFSSL